MGFENVGIVWTPSSLKEYLQHRKKPSWVDSITLHHTAAPSLAQRKDGLTVQHIKNIQAYYQKDKKTSYGWKKGWTTGPHLFIDEDEVFGMCAFEKKGIHASSFNSRSIGIEVLGYYDRGREDPKSGRGLRCWQNTADTVRVLLDWLNLSANEKTILFHRDDPRTTKSCPGTAVEKDWFLSLLPGEVSPPKPYEKPNVGIKWDKWHFSGERWCVPILDFLVAKGIPKEDVIAKLSSKNKVFYYDGTELEGAFYVGAGKEPKPDNASWASVLEIMEAAKLEVPLPLKPETTVAWDSWHLLNDIWHVPILTFLEAHGVARDQIITNLKLKNGVLHYASTALESSFYVPKGSEPSPDEASWADAATLLNAAGLTTEPPAPLSS